MQEAAQLSEMDAMALLCSQVPVCSAALEGPVAQRHLQYTSARLAAYHETQCRDD